MGIRIHRSTWSSPLQLIDTWLPPARPNPTSKRLSLVASRFVRAGWLQRQASNDEVVQKPAAPERPQQTVVTRILRVTPQPQHAGIHDGRVRLSGRLIDVCAELERLASLDHRESNSRHS